MVMVLLTLFGFAIAMALMAIGVMMRQQAPIRGCGESCRCFEREASSSPSAERED